MINLEVWIAIAGLFITLIGFLWKTASIYGDLKYQIRQNREDINRLGNALRKDLSNQTWIIFALIDHIQEHLQRNSNYYPPSLRRDEEQ